MKKVEDIADTLGQYFELAVVIARKLIPFNLTVGQVKDLIETKEHPFWVAFNEAIKLLVPKPLVIRVPPIILEGENPTLEHFLAGWPEFCKEFGLAIEVDFEALGSNPQITGRQLGFDWLVYCPKGLTTRQAIDLCKQQFKKVYEEIPVEEYSLERSLDKTDLVLCRATIEPDRVWLGKSADDMSATKTAFLDARERYMLEAFFYWLTKRLFGRGKHLDLVGWTRCPRSRTSCGGVAHADWGGGGFKAYWGNAGYRDPYAGGREAVPLGT
ncbi:MAG: hypothetical protein WCV82_03045 [Candidatus Paceibacterota bacterium]